MSGKDFQKLPKGFATKSLHSGYKPSEPGCMAVVPPIVTSASFQRISPAELHKYEYSRIGNPTRDVLERKLADLENGKHGLIFATGLGATASICQLMEAGDHLLASHDIYGGSSKLFSNVTARNGVEVTHADFANFDTFEKALKKNTKLVWFETPTNPTLKVIDIKAISTIAHNYNKDIIVAVDNSFLTPYFQRPLELGADIAMHSVSKYLNGHGDVVMGGAVVKCDNLHDRLRYIQNALGIVPSPFDCYLVIRSLSTLKIRMEEHFKSSIAVAKFLENHPFVFNVRHPGLPSHPDYEISTRQTSGHSGMIAFNIQGSAEQTSKFIRSLKIVTLAGSLGADHSLIAVPLFMSHAAVPAEEKDLLGITETLIRLSVGLEDMEDIIDDLDMALNNSQD